MTDIKQKAFKEFDKITLRLLKTLHTLSEEQINFYPKKGWSPGQIGEHLLKSYASIETLKGKTRQTNRPIDQKLDPIKTLFSDTSIKMKSPRAILPSKERIVKKVLIKDLEDRISQFKEIIKTKDLSLTCIDYAIPEYGEFTRFEWVWFNIFHTQRHLHQLESLVALNNLKTND